MKARNTITAIALLCLCACASAPVKHTKSEAEKRQDENRAEAIRKIAVEEEKARYEEAQARQAEAAAAYTKSIEDFFATHQVTSDQRESILHGRISVGMTSEMVRFSWGKPERVNDSIFANRTRSQWVYRNGNYVYFDDGFVSSIQTSH